jgi:NADH-quinone oxidoreductase subunit J
LGAKELPKGKRYIDLWEGRALIGLLLTGVFIGAFSSVNTSWKGKYTIEYIEKIGHTKALGIMLFNEYPLAVFLLGIILLIPMIAVAVIAWRVR